MGRELRREPRVRTHFDVEVETGGRTLRYTTRNASFRGMFLVSEQSLPLRRLVRVRCEVSGEALHLIGMIAHTVNPAEAHERNKQPGMGVSLFSLGPREREIWETFVRTESEKDPEGHAAIVAHEIPRLRISLKNDKMKAQFFKNDLPSGEIFYRTPELLELGTQVLIEVRKADTGNALELSATVKEIVDGARRKRGVKLAFDPTSDEAAARIARFEAGESSEDEQDAT